ncbi:unnamed protein product, partial [Rotaria sp. Silwood1]
NIVPRISTYVYVVKERAKNPPDDLSVDESAAIALYTMEWGPYTESLYYILNNTLRSEDRKSLKPWFLYLKLICTALSRLPSINLTVCCPVEDIIESEHEKYEVGKRLVWWSFVSCYRSDDTFQNDYVLGQTGTRTFFIIDCMAGKDIGKHSYYRRENEVLLLPATYLEVISYDSVENNLHVIYLQEIESSHVLLEPVSSEKESRSLRKMSSWKSKVRTPIIFATALERYRTARLNEWILRCKSDSDAYLNGQHLTKYGVQVVVEQLLIDKHCRVLFVMESHMTPEGALIISEALRNNDTLVKLFLSHNKLGDDGTKFLARALSCDNNSTLRELSLCHNGITDQGAEDLARMLASNETLTHLWLGSNKISDLGLERLCEVLISKNKTLQVLSLEWNRFRSYTKFNILVDMLEQNESLMLLNLENCQLFRHGVEQLIDSAKKKENFELLIN